MKNQFFQTIKDFKFLNNSKAIQFKTYFKHCESEIINKAPLCVWALSIVNVYPNVKNCSTKTYDKIGEEYLLYVPIEKITNKKPLDFWVNFSKEVFLIWLRSDYLKCNERYLSLLNLDYPEYLTAS